MDETSAEMLEQMEMVPIGSIEEVARKESRQQRQKGWGLKNEVTRYGRGSHGYLAQDEIVEGLAGRSGFGHGASGQSRHHSKSRWQHDRYEHSYTHESSQDHQPRRGGRAYPGLQSGGTRWGDAVNYRGQREGGDYRGESHRHVFDKCVNRDAATQPQRQAGRGEQRRHTGAKENWGAAKAS